MNVEFFKQTILNHSPRIHPWEGDGCNRTIFARMIERVLMEIENWVGLFIEALARPSLVSKQHCGYFETGPSEGTQVLAKANSMASMERLFQLLSTYLSLERDRVWLAIIQREGRGGYNINLLQPKS